MWPRQTASLSLGIKKELSHKSTSKYTNIQGLKDEVKVVLLLGTEASSEEITIRKFALTLGHHVLLAVQLDLPLHRGDDIYSWTTRLLRKTRNKLCNLQH